MRRVSTVDYHTAGEPFRIVPTGVVLPGATVLERRNAAPAHVDDVRRMLVDEPRGHADMYGGFVVAPDDAGAALGVVFWHAAGYSTACGHGTIALVTWAIEDGVLVPGADGLSRAPTSPSPGRTRRRSRDPVPDGEHDVAVDVPSGRVHTRATVRGGRVTSVAFRNVPAFVLAAGVPIAAAGGAPATVAYGGAFYAVLDAAAVGCDAAAADLGRLVAAGRAIKAELDAGPLEVVHPLEPDLRGIYGVIFTAGNRNVTVFADGEVDRSPCGSGTSTRLAVLHATGALATGEPYEHEGVVGTRFGARVLAETTVAGRPAVETEVVGSAWPTGRHEFVLHDEDPVGTGFRLR